MPRGFLVKRHELLLSAHHPHLAAVAPPSDALDLTSTRKHPAAPPAALAQQCHAVNAKKLTARVWRPALPDDVDDVVVASPPPPLPPPPPPPQAEVASSRLCLEAALRWYQQRIPLLAAMSVASTGGHPPAGTPSGGASLFHPAPPAPVLYPPSLASFFVHPPPISPLRATPNPPASLDTCSSSSDVSDVQGLDLTVKSAVKVPVMSPAVPPTPPTSTKKRGSATLASPASKKAKAIRKLTFDDELISPVSGTIIRDASEMEAESAAGNGMVVRPGDIDPAFNIVDVTDEARAELAKIENRIGEYACRLCRQLFDDAFGLAQHRCPRIVHVEYRCPECDKVFNCPANLASHRRWHKPRNPKPTASSSNNNNAVEKGAASVASSTSSSGLEGKTLSAASILHSHYQTVYGKASSAFYGDFSGAKTSAASPYYAPAAQQSQQLVT